MQKIFIPNFHIMIDLSTLFVLVVILAVLCLALLIYSIVISLKIKAITKKRSVKLEEGRVQDILDYLEVQEGKLRSLEHNLHELQSNQITMADDLTKCLCFTSIVRFNAFEDIGGEQSFALTMLDANKNGFVVSNLYGRQDSRVYIKDINNGESDRTLSGEEKRSLELACK